MNSFPSSPYVSSKLKLHILHEWPCASMHFALAIELRSYLLTETCFFIPSNISGDDSIVSGKYSSFAVLKVNEIYDSRVSFSFIGP